MPQSFKFQMCVYYEYIKKFKIALITRIILGAHHSVGFARRSLSVGENCGVETDYRGFYDTGHSIEVDRPAFSIPSIILLLFHCLTLFLMFITLSFDSIQPLFTCEHNRKS